MRKKKNCRSKKQNDSSFLEKYNIDLVFKSESESEEKDKSTPIVKNNTPKDNPNKIRPILNIGNEEEFTLTDKTVVKHLKSFFGQKSEKNNLESINKSFFTAKTELNEDDGIGILGVKEVKKDSTPGFVTAEVIGDSKLDQPMSQDLSIEIKQSNTNEDLADVILDKMIGQTPEIKKEIIDSGMVNRKEPEVELNIKYTELNNKCIENNNTEQLISQEIKEKKEQMYTIEELSNQSKFNNDESIISIDYLDSKEQLRSKYIGSEDHLIGENQPINELENDQSINELDQLSKKNVEAVYELDQSIKENVEAVYELDHSINELVQLNKECENLPINEVENVQSIIEADHSIKELGQLNKECENLPINEVENIQSINELENEQLSKGIDQLSKEGENHSINELENEQSIKESDQSIKESDQSINEADQSVNKLENKQYIQGIDQLNKECENLINEFKNEQLANKLYQAINEEDQLSKESEKSINEVENNFKNEDLFLNNENQINSENKSTELQVETDQSINTRKDQSINEELIESKEKEINILEVLPIINNEQSISTKVPTNEFIEPKTDQSIGSNELLTNDSKKIKSNNSIFTGGGLKELPVSNFISSKINNSTKLNINNIAVLFECPIILYKLIKNKHCLIGKGKLIIAKESPIRIVVVREGINSIILNYYTAKYKREGKVVRVVVYENEPIGYVFKFMEEKKAELFMKYVAEH